MRRTITVATAALALAVVATGFTSVQEAAVVRPDGCGKTYTRGMFHAAARKVYTRGNWEVTAAEKRKIRRYVHCQRGGAKGRHNVRLHLRRYKGSHARRFYWEIRRAPYMALINGHLASIAACESGGNPQAISASGAYRGKYQFSPATWASVGGSGDPAAAPVAEQDYRAALLYLRSGPGQWPVCGS